MKETPATILVVDDIPDNRDLLSRRLQRQGHSVIEAENGYQAIEKLEANHVDLVLLDIMMPKMNGYEVLEKMGQTENYRHIPVIMITAVDDMDSTIRCIKLGAADYLTKPFNGVLLKARVSACLDKKRFRDQERMYLNRIEEEKRRADGLLRVLLPDAIAEELQSTGQVAPKRYENVAVMFLDIVGFTTYCDRREPEEVVEQLQNMVERLEDITVKHGLEKIKTIGDAFMVTANLLQPADHPVRACVKGGFEMMKMLKSLPAHWTARVGIHVGPVVAGIVGGERFAFDVWGDTVNTAARMENHGEPGAVNLSHAAWETVRGEFNGATMGMISVKGKGELELIRLGDDSEL